LDITECDNYNWNGTNYNSSGTYSYSSLNSNGCDSTATLNLTINQSTTSNLNVIECDTYIWNGINYTSSGVYTFVTINANGCDSTATLNLVINSSTNSAFTEVECDSYSWNGITYTNSGVYTFATTNTDGCDSTATLDLTINVSSTNYVSISICKGDIYSVGNSDYSSSGVYLNVLSDTNGCDSTITTDLTVNNVPIQPVITQIFSTTLSTTNYNNYQWYKNGVLIFGETNQTINIIQGGVYTVIVTNNFGCSSESSGFNFGSTNISEEILIEFNVYPNPTFDILNITTPISLGKDYVIEIYDIIGKKVFEFDNYKFNYKEHRLDLNHLSTAFYKIIINYKNGEKWNTTINKR